MATSVKDFAAALADDLHASTPACEVRTCIRGICRRPGGRAIGTCVFGHAETATVCRVCASGDLYCTPCGADGLLSILTLTTEVA